MLRLLLVFILAALQVSFCEQVQLVARVGRSLSLLDVDLMRRQLNSSITLFRPIAEELPVCIAVDERNGTGYFTLRQQLRWVSFDGRVESNFLLGGVLDDTPTSIAFDWLTRKLYVAISTIGPDNSARIEVCGAASEEAAGREERAECAVILHDKLDYLHSLVLDPVDGNMYWINAVLNQVEKAFMNGMHHDRHPFQNTASGEAATLTVLTINRQAMSLFYVRTPKERSEIWHCTLYERKSCQKITDSPHIMHMGVFKDLLLISLNTGNLELCDWKDNCAKTRVAIEGVKELETFQVIERVDQRPAATPNPCAESNGGCSHLCVLAQYEPSATCACPLGVRLLGNGKTCDPRGADQVLFISAISGLFYISLDTTDYTPQPIRYEGYDDHLASHSLIDVDFDPVERFVYWMDITDATIRRCHLNGSSLSVVARAGVSSGCKTLRIDWRGRNLFWVDGERALIYISKLDGSLPPRVLLGHSLDRPHGLAIDYTNGVLYISDWKERNSRIHRVAMDGSSVDTLITLTHYSYPNGVELDASAGRVYWTESNHSLIRSVRTSDADGVQTFMQASNKLVQPYSITKIGNRIFCNSMAGRSFVEITLNADYGTGDYPTHVVESQVYGPVGLRAVSLHANATREAEKDACARNNGGCQHFCVPTRTMTARCLCTTGYELSRDGRQCERPAAFAVLLRGPSSLPSDVFRLSLRGPRNEQRFFVHGIGSHAIAADYDQVDDVLFIASRNSTDGCIQRVRLKDLAPRAEVVLEGATLKGIAGIAVDHISKNIYWTNTELGRVEVVENRGLFRRTIAWEGLRPTLIAVHASVRQLFVVSQSQPKSANSTILRMPLSGSRWGGEEVVSTAGAIAAIAVDVVKDQLYWSEVVDRTNTLHVARLSGQQRQQLARSEDRRLNALFHYKNALYYVDEAKSEFGYVDGTGFHSVHAAVANATALCIVHGQVHTRGTNACASKNGNCPELCLASSSVSDPSSTSSASDCVCRDHFDYNARTASCSPPTHGVIIGALNKLVRLKVQHDEKGGALVDEDPAVVLPIERVGLPLSIAVDIVSRRRTIFWIDANDARTLKSASELVPSTTTSHSLHAGGCVLLRSLALDAPTRQLFVSCSDSSGRSHVIVFRIKDIPTASSEELSFIGRVVDGDERRGVGPSSLRPLPTEIEVFGRSLAYLDGGTRSGLPVLHVCTLNGRECRALLDSGVHSFTRLQSLPIGSSLFFSAPSGIYVLSSPDSAPLSLVSLPNTRFLFAPLSKKTMLMAKMDDYGSSSVTLGENELIFNGVERTSALDVYGSEPELREMGALCSHLSCSHICSVVPGEEAECLCPLGHDILFNAPQTCVKNVTCEAWEYRCGDQRTCIHEGQKCDRRLDCPDGSDESVDACGTISPRVWQCFDRLLVIDRYLVCDGVPDCADGSDERGCRCLSPVQEMDCANWGRLMHAECVERRHRCDRTVDCANGADEDERLCEEFPPNSLLLSGRSSRHWLYIALTVVAVALLLPLVVFACTRLHSSSPSTTTASNRLGSNGRHYQINMNTEASILLPHEDVQREFEMTVRTYSVVESSTTYPELPPPIQSSGCPSSTERVSALSLGCNRRAPFHSTPRLSSHKPRPPSVVDIPLSRFYAPPPSAASLSTYGIVLPAATIEKSNTLRSTRHPHRSSSRNHDTDIVSRTPPPSYSQSTTLRRHIGSGVGQASPRTWAVRPTPARSSSSSSEAEDDIPKAAAARSNRRIRPPAPHPSPPSSSSSSSSLSSHPSDQQLSGSRKVAETHLII